MASQVIFAGQAYRNFIETIHSPDTRGAYKNSLSLYLRYRGADTCEQLLEGDPKIIQSQLIDYVICMREELRWGKIRSYIGRGAKRKNRKDRPYTHAEITKMLEKADQRGRIAILLMFSAGLRVGAITSLKIRDLEKIEKYQLYKIKVYENDDGEYTTFCTPECTREIDSYLEYRYRHGERSLKEDAPLIREQFNINDEIRAARPRRIDTGAFRKMIKMIGTKSGVIERQPVLYGRGDRRPVKMTHGLRKAFQTSAINAGMSPLYSEILMGHISGGLALESYLKPTDNDLLEGNDKMVGYVGVIDALTINEEHKLRREVEHYKVKASQFDSLKAEIDQLRELINK